MRTAWPAAGEDPSTTDGSRRNMLKWESDEDLGDNATISPILYCNLVHPELKKQYPGMFLTLFCKITTL